MKKEISPIGDSGPSVENRSTKPRAGVRENLLLTLLFLILSSLHLGGLGARGITGDGSPISFFPPALGQEAPTAPDITALDTAAPNTITEDPETQKTHQPDEKPEKPSETTQPPDVETPTLPGSPDPVEESNVPPSGHDAETPPPSAEAPPHLETVPTEAEVVQELAETEAPPPILVLMDVPGTKEIDGSPTFVLFDAANLETLSEDPRLKGKVTSLSHYQVKVVVPSNLSPEEKEAFLQRILASTGVDPKRVHIEVISVDVPKWDQDLSNEVKAWDEAAQNSQNPILGRKLLRPFLDNMKRSRQIVVNWALRIKQNLKSPRNMNLDTKQQLVGFLVGGARAASSVANWFVFTGGFTTTFWATASMSAFLEVFFTTLGPRINNWKVNHQMPSLDYIPGAKLLARFYNTSPLVKTMALNALIGFAVTSWFSGWSAYANPDMVGSVLSLEFVKNFLLGFSMSTVAEAGWDVGVRTLRRKGAFGFSDSAESNGKSTGLRSQFRRHLSGWGEYNLNLASVLSFQIGTMFYQYNYLNLFQTWTMTETGIKLLGWFKAFMFKPKADRMIIYYPSITNMGWVDETARRVGMYDPLDLRNPPDPRSPEFDHLLDEAIQRHDNAFGPRFLEYIQKVKTAFRETIRTRLGPWENWKLRKTKKDQGEKKGPEETQAKESPEKTPKKGPETPPDRREESPQKPVDVIETVEAVGSLIEDVEDAQPPEEPPHVNNPTNPGIASSCDEAL